MTWWYHLYPSVTNLQNLCTTMVVIMEWWWFYMTIHHSGGWSNTFYRYGGSGIRFEVVCIIDHVVVVHSQGWSKVSNIIICIWANHNPGGGVEWWWIYMLISRRWSNTLSLYWHRAKILAKVCIYMQDRTFTYVDRVCYPQTHVSLESWDTQLSVCFIRFGFCTVMYLRSLAESDDIFLSNRRLLSME